MKETETHYKDPLELKEVVPVKKQEKLLARSILKKGLKLWSLDVITGDVKEAEFEKSDVNYVAAVNGTVSSTRKVRVEPNFVYVQALNEKNARKKFVKMFQRG